MNLNEEIIYQQNYILEFDSRLCFLYQMVDESVSPLPRCLSLTDKSIKSYIDPNNPFQIEYSTNSVSERMIRGSRDNGCVRTDNPIPFTAGIYYFEIKVLSGGEKQRAYIGLTSSGTDLHRAPGWDLGTYGYHGDDGNVFAQEKWLGNLKRLPTFSTHDVIGCGVNFERKTCFFTKNGTYLGIAFRNMPRKSLYPTVGVASKSDSLEVNLGQHPFVYNITMEKF